VIITRTNDRRLRLTATDWVKNGERWTISHIGRHDVTVRHDATTSLSDYVREGTGLVKTSELTYFKRDPRHIFPGFQATHSCGMVTASGCAPGRIPTR
jgi:hypothetical protein